MSNPALYADIGKSANDLLYKEFPEKNKFEINTRTVNGVNFVTTLTRNNDGSILGQVNPKFTLKKQNVNVNATVDTKRTLKVEASIDQAFPGLKATVSGNNDTESVKAEFEYKHPHLASTASIDFLSAKGNTANGSLVLGYEKFAIGAQVEEVFGDKQELKQFNFVGGYRTDDWTFTLFSRQKGDVVGGTYFQKLNDKVSVAADVAFEIDKPADSPKLTVGASYKADDQTTFKGRFDTEGKLALSYAQKLNPNIRFTTGLNVNTNDLSAAGSSTLAFSFVFSD